MTDKETSREIAELKEKVQAHGHALFGNGAIGMVEQIKTVRKMLISALILLSFIAGEQAIPLIKMVFNTR